ncbi:hypothetical protein HDU93_003663, partial [Gonapodya sp. JEL0774]
GVIGPQVYQPSDAPYYSTGHFINAACLIGAAILYAAAVISIIREGEYVGKKANITVAERGGLELSDDKLITTEHLLIRDSVNAK